MSKQRAIGTAFETLVATHARQNGFPAAERLALKGKDDEGDVRIHSQIHLECKGGKAAETASDGQILKWIEETERERCRANIDHAFLITKRANCGKVRAGDMWVHTQLVKLLMLYGIDFAPIMQENDPVHVANAFYAPMRMTLDDLLRHLKAAGYGTNNEEN